MSKKKKEEPKKTTEVTDDQKIGNDYYAEAEGIKTLRGTTIIVNINTGQPPNPPPPPPYKP